MLYLLTFDLRSRALCNCAASEPWSGPSELDDRDILGAGGGGGGGGAAGVAFHGGGPVSYTHLDVYKRQEYWLFSVRNIRICSDA